MKPVCGCVVGGGGINGDDCVTSSGGFVCIGGCGEYNIHHKPPQPVSRIQKGMFLNPKSSKLLTIQMSIDFCLLP